MVEGDGEEVDLATSIDRLVETVRLLHDTIVRTTGGLGERTASLRSACGRPFTVVGGERAYPTYLEMAAAMFHGIICGHAFADGNKRTGTIIAASFIELDEEVSRKATPNEI